MASDELSFDEPSSEEFPSGGAAVGGAAVRGRAGVRRGVVRGAASDRRTSRPRRRPAPRHRPASSCRRRCPRRRRTEGCRSRPRCRRRSRAVAVGTAVRRRIRAAERSVDDVRAGDGRGQVGIRASAGGPTERDGAPSSDPEPRSSRSESRLESRCRGACRPTGSPPSGRRCCGRRCCGRRRCGRRRSTTIRTAWCRPWSTAGAPSAAATIPAPDTVALPGSPVPIGPSSRAARSGVPADCNAAITWLTGASAAARGRGSAGGGDRGRPGVRRLVHPDAGDDRAVAEGVAAEHRGDGEQRTRRDRGPMGRRPGAGLEEVARAGDERPVHGMRGAAALPAEQGADGDEAVRLGVGGRDDGPHAGKVGCAAVPGSGGGCHVRRLSRGAGERVSSCCLYDNTADHHTRHAHLDPCRRRVTVRTRRASPTARRARLPRPDERRHTDGRSGLSVTRVWRAPGFHPAGPAGRGVGCGRGPRGRPTRPARPPEDRDPARRRR